MGVFLNAVVDRSLDEKAEGPRGRSIDRVTATSVSPWITHIAETSYSGNTAPGQRVERPPPSRRLRRRGPRSLAALTRRSESHFCREQWSWQRQCRISPMHLLVSIHIIGQRTLEQLMQCRFIREVGHSELQVLIDFRRAPLASRRDMAMWGLLHRVSLHLAPSQTASLFPIICEIDQPFSRQRLRNWTPKHNRQLATPAHFQSSDVLRRSVFGLVHCYNRLPQSVVDKACVKTFQRQLQSGLLAHAESVAENWSRLVSRENRMPMPRFHALLVGL